MKRYESCCAAQLIPLSVTACRSDVYRLFCNVEQRAGCCQHVVHRDMTPCAHARPPPLTYWHTHRPRQIPSELFDCLPPSLCDSTTPANLSSPRCPDPLRGGPLPETPSNKSSGLLLAALTLGFLSVQVPSALCLPHLSLIPFPPALS